MDKMYSKKTSVHLASSINMDRTYSKEMLSHLAGSILDRLKVSITGR
jgi:hypothetical protein